jgi:hypothetical protein
MHDFFRKMVTYVDEMARKTHAMLADGSAMKGLDHRRRVSAQLDAVPPFSPMLFIGEHWSAARPRWTRPIRATAKNNFFI